MANKKTKKTAPRGRRPEPYTVGELRDAGDSVLHMSKRARTLLGTGLGAALGAVVGQLAAEDPEKFGQVVTSLISAFNGGGIMASVTPPSKGKDWVAKRSAAMWHCDMKDRKLHAYEMAFDGGAGMSACGQSKQSTLEPVSLFAAGKAPRCEKCVEILAANGYDTKIPGSAAAPPWAPGEPVVTPEPCRAPRPDFFMFENLRASLDGAKEDDSERWSVRIQKSGKLVLRVVLNFVPSDSCWHAADTFDNDEKKRVIVSRLAEARNAWSPEPTTH